MPPLREQMRAEVARLAELVGAGPRHLPDWDHARGDATPHVEVHGGLMSWVVSERGQEYERRTTGDLYEWLSWVFTAATKFMANDWELQRRIPYVESRITNFVKHLELLERLDPAWAESELEHYAAVLARHPYTTRDYSPAARRSAAGYLVNTVRGPQDNSVNSAAAPASEIDLDHNQTVFATRSLIADGLRRNGVAPDEIRRIDRWACRLPAPNPVRSHA